MQCTSTRLCTHVRKGYSTHVCMLCARVCAMHWSELGAAPGHPYRQTARCISLPVHAGAHWSGPATYRKKLPNASRPKLSVYSYSGAHRGPKVSPGRIFSLQRDAPYILHQSSTHTQVIARLYQSEDAALRALQCNSQILLPVYSSPALMQAVHLGVHVRVCVHVRV